jgi:hypothetical protein
MQTEAIAWLANKYLIYLKRSANSVYEAVKKIIKDKRLVT